MSTLNLIEERQRANLLTLENSRLKRQLEIQREITKEWERRFDKLLDGVKVTVEGWSRQPAPEKPRGLWRRMFDGRTDRPFCP